ncbi:unnamed protein product [Symbiodinium natans]|uniref:Uncharacterized protein n=1 Tax=Symbiodinium natans TaxID=878477 RepID=A0A812JQ71_9DINO|nr:unnamed protein product [Symbiodinium natans]
MARAFVLLCASALLCRVLSDTLQVTAAEAATFQCMNPLFRIQWYTGANDLAQLEPRPVVHDRLLRCARWNGKPSCCNTNLEPFQLVVFDAHRDRIEAEVHVLEQYLASMVKLRSSEVYENALQLEQHLLDRAVDAVRSALEEVKPCVLHLLAFVAGMTCFSCQPDWVNYVWRNGLGQVVGVNVDPNACIYVDRGCGAFGHAVQQAYLHMMESQLAKSPKESLPDFSMFFSREALCKWLRGTVALQPMAFKSSVLARRLSPEASISGLSRELSSAVEAAPSASTPLPEAVVQATAIPTSLPLPQAPTGPSSPALAFDPAKDGLASDFRVDFSPA